MALIDVISYEVRSNELVGKFESEDIKLGSQLVVHPSQTAIFVKSGQILGTFTSGTYTLSTKNIPLLNKVVNLPFGESPFKAEVWFVNQTSILDFKWGTTSAIQVEDPKYHIIIPVRGYGQYGFHINNPLRFFEQLVGNMPTFQTDKITAFFRGVILSKLTNIISDQLTTAGQSVVTINSHVDEISGFAFGRLKEVFDQYGIELEMFHAISITVDEQDPSFRRLKSTMDDAAQIAIFGRENYQMARSFDVLEEAARNEGGGAINAAMGIGAGLGIGGQVGTMVGQTIQTDPEVVPPLPQVNYYFGLKGQKQGPFTLEVMKQKLAAGEIALDSLVWKKGLSNWQALHTLEEFEASSAPEEECPPPLPKA